MKISIKKEEIIIKIDDPCGRGYESLSPKQVLDLIHRFQTVLFEWREMTGEKVDDPKCH